ncbi:MAG: PAS domain S-box protein [Cyanobacteria bacterium SBC]|nr:PAS domain S-box protein [Cyanobacteria bacterium SBC]
MTHPQSFYSNRDDRSSRDANDSLTLSERQLRLLFDTVCNAMAIVDDAGRCLEINQSACKVFGRSQASLFQQNLTALIKPNFALSPIGQSNPNPRTQQGDWQILQPDGSHRTVQYKLTTHIFPHRHLIAFRDLPSCNLEREREHDERLRVQAIALEACANSIVITDRTGAIEWVNPAFAQLTGYTTEEAIGKNPRDLVKSDRHDRTFYQNMWDTILDGRVWQGEMENRRKDGSFYTEEMTITPVRNTNGEIAHFIAIKQNVTERKRLQENLLETSVKLQDVLKTSSAGIIRFWLFQDRTYQSDYFSPACEHLFGYSTDELDLPLWTSRVLPEDFKRVIRPALEQVRAGKTEIQLEYRFRHRNNSLRWISDSVTARYHETRKAWLVTVVATDITDRKRAEDAFQQSARLFQTAFSEAPIGMALVGLDQRFQQVNAALCQILGYSEEDLLQKTVSEITHPLDRERENTYKQESIAGDRLNFQMEKRYLHADGHIVWGNLSVSLVRDGDGNPLYYIGQLEDITDRKQSEIILRDSEVRYRTLVENIPGVVYRCCCDAEWTIVFISEAIENIAGYPASDFLENRVRSFQSIIHPDDESAVRAAALDAIERREDYVLEYRLIGADGRERWIYEKGQGFWDDADRLLYLDGVLFDIGDRKQAEFALQESEQRFRVILETISLVGVMLDRDGKILLCNDFLLQLTGWQREEVVHRDWFDIFVPPEICDDLREQVFSVTIASGQFPTHYENDIVTRTGERRSILWNNTVLFDRDGNVISVASIGEDITDRKRAERELQERYRIEQVLELCSRELLRGDDGAMTEVLKHLLVATQVDRVYVFENVYDTEERLCARSIEKVVASDLKSPRENFQYFVYEDGFDRWMQCLERGETIGGLVATLPPSERDVLEAQNIASILVLPLTVKGQWYGFIGFNSRLPRDWTAADVKLLRLGVAKIGNYIDRKQAEAALHESERKLRQITNAVPGAVYQYQIDARGEERFVFMSEGIRYLIGVSPKQIMEDPKLMWKAVVAEDVDRIRASTDRSSATLEKWSLEFRVRTPSGQIKWILGESLPHRRKEGGIRWDGLLTDISDRKRVEENLRRFEGIVAATSDGMALLVPKASRNESRDYVYQIVNLAYAERFGRSPEELVGCSLSKIFNPETLESTIRPRLERCLAGETLRYELWYDDEFIDPQFLSVTYSPYLEPNGIVSGIVVSIRNLTDLKRIEENLRVSEERFRALFEQAQVGIAWVDRHGRFVQANQRYCALLGYTEAELQNLTYEDITHPEDVDRNRRYVAAVFQGEVPDRPLEKRYLRKDGRVQWVSLSPSPVYDAAGNLRYLAGMVTDISDRKEAEAEVEAVTQRLTLATTSAQIGIWDFDLTRNHLLWDARMYELYQVAPAEFEGVYEDWQRQIAPEDSPAVERQFQASISENREFHVEFRIVWPDGQLRFIEAYGIVLRDLDGTPQRIIGVNWDITDRKNAEERLRQSETKYRILVEQMPAAVYTAALDEVSTTEYISAQIEPMFGYSQQEWLDNPELWYEQLHPDDRATVMEGVLAAQANNEPFVQEYRIFDRQGQMLWVLDRAMVVYDDDGHPLFLQGILLDITARKNAEDLVRRQAERERLFGNITRHIRQSLDLERILNATVVEVRHLLNVDRVSIYRFRNDWSGETIVESVLEPWASVLGSVGRVPSSAQAQLAAFRQGGIDRMENIETADLDPRYAQLLKSFQVRAYLMLPINCDDRLWGLLVVHHCRSLRQWESWEVEFLQQLADQVSIAIQQSQLLERTAIQAQRERLLNEIVAAIRNSLDLDQILQQAVNGMLQALRASRSMVSLCSIDDEFFQYTMVESAPGVPLYRGRAIPLRNNPHAQRILSQEEPLATDDVEAEALLAPMLPIARQVGIRAMLDVAIRHEGVVKGMLCLHQCDRTRHWTDDEKLLIEQVADQLAIAIGQAELYKQAQTELAEREKIEAKLRHDALHDTLTDLANRTLLMDRLHHALQRVKRQQRTHPNHVEHFVVLFLDLDRFKVINDSLGHQAGDRLLQMVAKRLQSCIRSVDTAARLGGDEFVILLEDVSDIQYAIKVARRIHQVLEDPIFLDNHEIFISASMGIVSGTAEYDRPDRILQDADIAMYRAKDNNRKYELFNASMYDAALRRMQLENALRHAIERQEFCLYFQPIVDLKTQKIRGFEALIRWQHPEQGLVSPGDFIPIAEDTGSIVPIDFWVLREACHQLQSWQEAFPDLKDLFVGVNLSGRHFSRKNLIERIDRTLQETNLAPNCLKIEVTESILIQNAELAAETLSQLRSRNIRVCLDDFGTGYSSLSYLHRFPIHTIKIDRSFVSTISRENSDSGNFEIVKAILNLALNLNLETVAEGVETEEQLDFLNQNNCHCGQGYYFARPLDSEAATTFLYSQSRSVDPGSEISEN